MHACIREPQNRARPPAARRPPDPAVFARRRADAA